jgi:hypothetical protein
MFVKALAALAVLAAIVWMLRPRAIGRGRQASAPRVPHADDLEKCARCGVWLPAGYRCDCDSRGQAPSTGPADDGERRRG